MREKRPSGGRAALTAAALACLLAASVVLAICVGKYPVRPAECLRLLWQGLWGLPADASEMTQNVVFGLRVPRVLASVLVGAALSMSGAAYQGVFQNPLISPDFLGVSSGACIGAAAAILLSLPSAYLSLFAFIGGVLAVLLASGIPALIGNRTNLMLVLSGIIVGAALSSLLGFLKYVADPDTQLASITYWTMGSFSYVTMRELLAVLPLILVPAALLIGMAWWIDVLSMGETEARALGANVRLVRGLAVGCATLLTAASVCVSGTIGWVGLVVPHLARMLVGPENRRLIPVSGLAGALFMLLVDTLTRTIGASEMPVSILTGVIGAPFYCFLLLRQRRRDL